MAKPNSGTSPPHLARPPCDFEAPVVAVAFDPEGRTAVAGTRKGAIHIWDATTGQSVGPIQTAPQKLDPRVAALPTALDPGSRILMLFGREDARRWEPAAGRPSASLPVLDKNVTAVAFSPDGQTVLIGDMGKTIRRLGCDHRPIPRRAPRRRGHSVAYCVQSRRQSLFDRDGQQRRRLGKSANAGCGDRDTIGSAAAAPCRGDGRCISSRWSAPIAAGGRDGDVRFWDGPTGKSLGPPLNHSGAVRAVAFDKAGQRLAVAGS